MTTADTLKRVDIHDLLTWAEARAIGEPTAEELAASLTVEGTPYDQVPVQLLPALTAFRHLRTDAREAKCRKYLSDKRVIDALVAFDEKQHAGGRRKGGKRRGQ